jgi:Domain of unknown function (DUF222)
VPVVIHVVAEQASLDGTTSTPGSTIGADALLPAELIADLARSATLRPLIHPLDAPPEPGYTPSQALADFVSCRDLTCRFPSCDRPARDCDIDHTIAHADGGPTHASNLKCLCRLHHQTITFELGETWLRRNVLLHARRQDYPPGPPHATCEPVRLTTKTRSGSGGGGLHFT